jgi:DNA-binding NarL/FixJ family response regulator
LSSANITVLILDDQLVQRNGIAHVVKGVRGMEVIGTFGISEEAMALMKNRRIDLALVDLVLENGRDGISVGHAMRRLQPSVKVVIYTRENSMVLAAEIFREVKNKSGPGLQGYLLTRNITSSSFILNVYGEIVRKGYYMDQEVLKCHYQLSELEPGFSPSNIRCMIAAA